MDTRYWGPSGWRLLHLVAASPNAANNRTFWEMLPYVLPCKFCRASLTTFYELHPIPTKASQFPSWLYTIHSCVNEKLRSQCKTTVHISPTPSEEEVKLYYTNLLKQGCTKTQFPGWKFLFSIADNHPRSSPSKPMPDAPETMPTTLEEKNKWNCLTPEERLPVYNAFWKIIGLVLPFKEWRESWAKHPVPTNLHSRELNIKWLWKVRCTMESDLELLNSCKYSMLCKTLQNHRSDCSKRVRGKTCRKRTLD